MPRRVVTTLENKGRTFVVCDDGATFQLVERQNKLEWKPEAAIPGSESDAGAPTRPDK